MGLVGDRMGGGQEGAGLFKQLTERRIFLVRNRCGGGLPVLFARSCFVRYLCIVIFLLFPRLLFSRLSIFFFFLWLLLLFFSS